MPPTCKKILCHYSNSKAQMLLIDKLAGYDSWGYSEYVSTVLYFPTLAFLATVPYSQTYPLRGPTLKLYLLFCVFLNYIHIYVHP